MIRPIAWLALLLQLSSMALLAFLGHTLVGDPAGALIGIAVYLAYSLFGRLVIAKHHRRGIRLVRGQRYAEAIEHFEKSYAFFSRHLWIDRRSITLLSAAAMSYREMALVNIAFCYSQIGRGAAAKDYYQRAIAEFPDNGMALAALKLIKSAEQTVVS
jgi:tetratricopeptide (TPR) repeat protein